MLAQPASPGSRVQRDEYAYAVAAKGMSPGVRGLALLAITGIVGLILAVHGWSARRSGFLASTAGGLSAPSPSPKHGRRRQGGWPKPPSAEPVG